MKFEAIAVENIPLIHYGDDLPSIICENIELQDRDIVIIASTVVAKAEGETFRLEDITAGEKALEMVWTWKPDMLLLDLALPGINGKEVCQRVRGDSTMDDVRIICISGMVEEDKIEDLRAAGANDFIHKPFEVDQLIERMCQLLDIETMSAG